MKKVRLLMVLMVMVVCVVTSVSAVSYNSVISLKNGVEYMLLDHDVYLIGDTVYIPVREVFEKLNIPVMWDGTKNEVTLMTNQKTINTFDGTELKPEGVIPDEKIACQIGKTILEKYMESDLEYETDDCIYYLQATYHSFDNSWRVSQECRHKHGGGEGGTGMYSPTIILDKNTGEVRLINSNKMFD